MDARLAHHAVGAGTVSAADGSMSASARNPRLSPIEHAIAALQESNA
ncbi:hypothetical protein LU699_16815 [Luteimonas fraxinea]|uniref:Uncharacterized protein n=1 Tax=Luteimonas fraxinea TaxID=2901869 RepID=A0ABS8UDF7_9GAMM|nr:hypothetical protein [Luteimonas fraxinea]MCD9096754.1 hypothetical protein [Luteimonas fraxinea]MCD9126123.1 hypothetical protein [Luteimonas fraxinea]UHH09897.1 hypothetical protein LU699_16815 [Luteimonas fraxinea]